MQKNSEVLYKFLMCYTNVRSLKKIDVNINGSWESKINLDLQGEKLSQDSGTLQKQ